MYSGASNQMIMDILKIPKRTFYLHLDKIAKEDLEYQMKQNHKYMAMHLNRTREGLLKLQRMALDLAIKADTPHGVKLDSLKFIAELEVSLLKLEHEGTTLFQVIPCNGPNRDQHKRLVLQANYLQSGNGEAERGPENTEGDSQTKTTEAEPEDKDAVF
jgi:hypothetical protein